ncbi:hypothetical protein ACIQF6_35800 [Kitasatospora sp. NPDC092948]|uniref:hypothetical protein n=1 Tax=Kitasatospora sp. NPDC092948 TaxID=3364088 RepID=UPI003825361E
MSNRLLPDPLPRCRRHGRMRLRPPETREQEFCGVWYRCAAPECAATALVASAGLQAQLAAQSLPGAAGR